MPIRDQIHSASFNVGHGRTALGCAVALALALAGLMPAGAQAAAISYSYSGTVSGGNDVSGLFGGGDLTGASITVSTYYDPTAYSSNYFNVLDFYDIFSHDTAGASSVTVSLTTLSNQTFTRTLTSGGAYIGNDYLYTQDGYYGDGVYGVMAGFGSTEATLQPTLRVATGAFVSGTSIYNAPGPATIMSFIASIDATNGSLSDNITITNLSQNNPAPEPASWAVLGVGAAALAWARRRRAA